MATEDFLTLSAVSKQYGSIPVVNDINLAIGRKEFVTFLGPSGCGKTTTLRMIAGFIQPSDGEIRFGGRVMSSAGMHVAPEERNVGMVFQSYAVWPHMSVRENIELPLKLRKMSGGEVAARTDQVLTLCRLSAVADRSPHQLSGGQLQRVALARALAYRPPVVLLDEPLSNLDVALREELRTELRNLHRAMGACFILVTHDQVEAMSLSDRVVVMSEGRVQQVGSPASIYTAPANDFVARFVGAANLLDGLVESLPSSPDGLCTVKVGHGSLLVRHWQGARVGDRITLAVHPESIRVESQSSASKGGDNGFEASIVTASFLGRTQETVVQGMGIELRTAQLRSSVLNEGQRAWVSISSHAILPLGVDQPPATRVLQ